MREFACNRLVKLCSASYKRRYENVGYIYNSLTRKEQFLDQNGAELLGLVERKPTALTDILLRYKSVETSTEEDTRQFDPLKLLDALESDGFILTGASEAELNAKDPKFRYGMERRKRSQASRVEGYLPHTKEFFFERFENKSKLFRFQMEVTSKCNEKCVHCYHPPDWFVFKDIDTKLGLKVLDELKEEGAINVCFSGGEAFLHKEFDKLLYRARGNDLVIIILTNATHISDHYIEVLKEVQPEEVQVSLYSMTPEEHDQITKVRGSHRRTMDGINRLMDADIYVSIGCPVMKGNKHCYKDVIRWADQKGIMVKTDFMLYACTDLDQTNLSNRLSVEDVGELIQDTLKYNSSYRAKVDRKDVLVDPLDMIKKPPCGAGRDSLAMDANGDYYFCPVFRPSVLGNPEKDRLKDVWNKSKPLQELREITWGDFPSCTKCEAFNYCSMCFARNANENNGDHLEVNKHCCEISFLNKRIVEEYWKGTKADEQLSQKKSFRVLF